jgi:predicted alpha/beta-fold hydrolase
VRVFRMDQRGSGAGRYLAKKTYHSGRSDDVLSVVENIGDLTGRSPLMVCGFSLGANLTLRMLGDRPEAVPDFVTRAMAICPPVSLIECITRLEQGWSRFYDRYFARTCLRDVLQRARMIDGMHLPAAWSVDAASVRSRLDELGRSARAEFTRNGWLVYSPPGSLREFDAQFTAPVAGFDTVEEYYRTCGSLDEVARIRVPTRIVAAVNDPMIPVSQYDRMELSPAVRLHRVPGGGHLGFVVPSSPGMRDGCWIDASVVEWATASDRAARRVA